MMRDASCRRFRLCYYGGHIESGGETTMVVIEQHACLGLSQGRESYNLVMHEKEQCLVDELTKCSVIRQLLKRAGIS